MKLSILFILIGLTTNCFGQQNFNSAKIQEYNFYRLDYNDSFKISYYKSGAIKYEQNEKYEIWYSYIDSSKNDSLYNKILTLPRFSFQDCKDSAKDIFKYKNGILSEINTFEKICYKQDGGCFKYDNTNAGKWILTLRQFIKVNDHKDYIEQSFISQHHNRFDTTLFTFEYTYDIQGRKIQYITYEDGKLKSKIIYKYFDNTRREEFYYPEDSSAREITDYKYLNGQLVEKHIDRKFNSSTNTEKYLYIKPNRLSSIEYIGDETNLYKVRKYYYE